MKQTTATPDHWLEPFDYTRAKRPMKPGQKLSVLAVDPGGMTGWSIMTTTIDKIADRTMSLLDLVDTWRHGEIPSEGDFGEQIAAEVLYTLLEHVGVHSTAVVLENFVPQRLDKSKAFLSPVRLNSAFEQLLFQEQVAWTKQMPREKNAMDDNRLKAKGFYERGMGHARDADRHALLFLQKLQGNRTLMQKSFPLLQW